ncbi:hypothetical protein [Haloterrigena alkaliphila]|uniref:Uncharacterized protein n=1 Tax=Haloterrigena alkaliphila TaxID=2816475 RepID=A0A8A2VHZ9_9EURY|nr:hypothetical protein [Haloterrigena alkaliphila]QSW99994.1 hypothetical protein J0X25_03245 [Haloterrigena alkaliphila]
MSELSDRLLLLVIAGTGLIVFTVGWAGGLVESKALGEWQTVLIVALALVAILLLVGLWKEFDLIDTRDQ